MNESHIFFNNLKGGLPKAVRGEGMYIYDEDNNRYIDGIGGLFVNSIGHGVPEIADAIAEQARTLNFVNYVQFTNEPREQLAKHIIDMAPDGMDRVFFVPSGSSANEIALQIAREYHVERGNATKYKVIGQWHNYYGMSIGALSMSGNLAVRRKMNMSPYFLNFPHIQPPHCYQCPFNLSYPSCGLACANDLQRVIEQEGPEKISAFIATPIIGGTGGAIVPPPDYFKRIREICDKYDILLIIDEVITGFGRLGTNFGIDHFGITPDIMTAAKSLSSGYAAHGAVIAHKHIWDTFRNGDKQRITLLSTFAGHPLSCAASLAVQRYIAKHNLIERCAERGDYFMAALKRMAENEELIGDVRGKGLFVGIEFVQDRTTREPYPRERQLFEKVVFCAKKRGLIVSGRFGTGTRMDGDFITMSPPFIITEEECDEIVAILADSIKEAKTLLNASGTFEGGAT